MDVLCPKCHRPYNGKHCFKCGYINKDSASEENSEAQSKSSSATGKADPSIHTDAGSLQTEAANALFARYKKNAFTNQQKINENNVLKDEHKKPAAATKNEGQNVKQEISNNRAQQNVGSQQIDSKLSAFQQYYKKSIVAQPANNVGKQDDVSTRRLRNPNDTNRNSINSSKDHDQNIESGIRPSVISQPEMDETSPSVTEDNPEEQNTRSVKQKPAAAVGEEKGIQSIDAEHEPDASDEDAIFNSMFHPKDPDLSESEKPAKKKSGLFEKKEKTQDNKQAEKDERLKNAYNQNEDHYYDDTEPYYEAERQKFTLEDGLKIFGMILGVFLLIVFLIFYL